MSSALRQPPPSRSEPPGWHAAGKTSTARDTETTVAQRPATPPRLRELRTTDATPNVPRLELLFGRERPAPARTLLIWDPADHWPMLSLASLARPVDGQSNRAPTHPAQSAPQEVRLRREDQIDPLLSVQHVRIATEAGELGVMRLTAPPAEAVSLRLALALLEQADHAVILAGSAFDADLQRRVRAQHGRSGWQGPPVILVAPADRPSRAQRLRRLDWPLDLRTEVIELPRQTGPQWTQRFVERIRLHGSAPAGAVSTAAASTAARVRPPTPTAGPSVGPDALARPDTRSIDLSTDRIEAALEVVLASAGVRAAAWLCPGAPARQVCRGDAAQAPEAIATAEALWACAARRAAGSPLEALAWQTADHHLALLPVDRPVGGLLLAIADRLSGDPANLRWQLVVARNALG